VPLNKTACLASLHLLVTGGFAFVSSAQISTPPSPSAGEPFVLPARLSLPQAERLLAQRSLAATANRYQLEAARAGRMIAGYKPNPSLQVGAEQVPVRSPVPGSVPRLFATNPDAGANPVYTAQFSKLIERGSKRELRVEQADAQVDAAQAQIEDTLRIQLFQLRQAFTAAMLARDNLVLAEQISSQYDQTESLTAIRVRAGELAVVESVRVRAGRLPYQQAIVQSRATYEAAIRDV